ncbi:hydantoinase B/oxoprolinase family protein [Halegenticoccus tardaugens]|uniref:hydantoinase B/oxoprolinase family protein n=1 Tax=Halegenticoccus tardaugens TaxID=2071624 RepID=UPI00100A3795|nr:hydantoinase B/oxoprolinase family protein [Halegenticoccus tardaugens]
MTTDNPDTTSTNDITTDQVTLNTVSKNLVSICREMGINLKNTAYSPIFNEGLDFSCAVFDANAEMIGQAEFCPAQIGAMPFIVEWCVEEMGKDAFEPGDVVLHNDPYRGGCHIPEHFVMKPAFHDGELVGFAASIGHMAEIGGKIPGGFAADATEVFQEGYRLPPVKIVEGGEDVESIWKIILNNVRTPRVTYGDLRALVSSVDLGQERLEDLVSRYGIEEFGGVLDDVQTYSERRMRSFIESIPNGTYEGSDYMDDDGINDGPFKLHVSMEVRDDEIVADWSGTDDQTDGPINATFGVTSSATWNSLLQLYTGEGDMPVNAGSYRPVHVIAPPGTIANVDYPKPEVGGNTETHPRMVNTVYRAMADALPDNVTAADGSTCMNFLFGGVHPDTEEPYVNYHLEGMGWGGRPFGDGNDSVIVVNGNCRNTPVEVFETRYPWLTDSYSLRQDSGGPGEYRGGLGIERVIESWAPQITVSALFDRMKNAPWGLQGGEEGAKSSMEVMKADSDEWKTFVEAFGTDSPSKFADVKISKGDKVRIRSPGGGGYGDPADRDGDLVREDVEEGFVSVEAAEQDYGMTIEKSDAPSVAVGESND